MTNLGERLPFPVDRAYGMAAGLGHSAVEYFGQTKAIENIEAVNEQREAEERESQRIIAALPSSRRDGVRHFYDGL